MPTITLTEIECVKKQDIGKKDEPVLFIAGREEWEGKLEKGEKDTPDAQREFTGSVIVELKERDNNNPNKDKLLKKWTIDDDIVSAAKKLTTSSSGFHYNLWYTVT